MSVKIATIILKLNILFDKMPEVVTTYLKCFTC